MAFGNARDVTGMIDKIVQAAKAASNDAYHYIPILQTPEISPVFHLKCLLDPHFVLCGGTWCNSQKTDKLRSLAAYSWM